PRDPDPSFDEPVDDAGLPLEFPDRDRAPPGYHPHDGDQLAPDRGDEQPRHGRGRVVRADPDDDPAPF
ncbi:hypothetical protein, partial [Pseudonocardia sp. KRD291]|uniref:hypothetical protein n=1 Tax=Pseudonocardia sp. KRD291 TaxID=2792007 RepID=UPI001C4A314B